MTKKKQKAKPILFSTDMVRAIIDKRKTQTRRVAKGLPKYLPDGKYRYDGVQYGAHADCAKPPYVVGDLLYVRETWREFSLYNDCAEYDCPIGCTCPRYLYAAECIDDEDEKWRPSIHMPKDAARIFLRVTDLRLERLQDITEEDAMAEGVTLELPTGISYECYAHAFEWTWNMIYRKRPAAWSGYNPWVWVITFNVEECVK